MAFIGLPREPGRSTSTATTDHATVLDGLPVLTDGSSADDPEVFARRIARSAEAIEGMFALARLDLVNEVADIYTDPLGNLAVFEASRQGNHYVSNSLAAIAAICAPINISHDGVSTFLTLGWYASGGSPVAGVSAIPGGTSLRLAPGRPSIRRRYFSPGHVTATGFHAPDLSTVCTTLVGQVQSAASSGTPLKLGLTAGQDSRVCLAVALAADVQVEAYTEGDLGDVDVDIAREVARSVGVAHTIIPRKPIESLDMLKTIRQYVGAGDAASSFAQFEDHFAQLEPTGPRTIKLLGLGGEVARTNTHPIRAFLASGPRFVGLRSIQLALLSKKISLAGGLVRPVARDISVDVLNRWFDARLAEGWPARQLAETAYVFDSMVRTHQGSRRRTAGTSDLFAPLSSRPFIEHALNMPPRDRYEPGILQSLIDATTPALLNVRVEPPFHRTRAALAPIVSTTKLLGLGFARRHGEAAGNAQAVGDNAWAMQIGDHLELVENAGSSELFSIIDRGFLIETLRGKHPVTSGVLRALSLLWWFESIAYEAPPPIRR